MNELNPRGYFGIGIVNTKIEANVGTLWRSASILGATFIFTIGKRYKKQATDTMKSWKHTPLVNYETFDDFYKCIPYDCELIGVELDERSEPITSFKHPERAVYLLGAEDYGIKKEELNRCHRIVQIPGDHCMNVSAAGTIVMYDRILKNLKSKI